LTLPEPSVVIVLVVSGAVLVPAATWWGLRLLDEPLRWPRLRAVAVLVGMVGGFVTAAGFAREGAWVLPALAVWAGGLCAAACCDLVTMRMPRRLLYGAVAATAPLIAVAALQARSSAGPLWAGVTAGLLGAGLLWLGWRFGPIGRSDSLMALLGGLALGFGSARSVVPAVAAMFLVALTQLVVALARGAGRKTPLPFGPSLAALFLAAVLFA
jgi:leader peptidase (prepilin peptidase)/N-methyltransferase